MPTPWYTWVFVALQYFEKNLPLVVKTCNEFYKKRKILWAVVLLGRHLVFFFFNIQNYPKNGNVFFFNGRRLKYEKK